MRRIEDGALVGRIEATCYGRWAEIAYVFGPTYWGHGYATEASRWLLGYLSAALAIDEVWAAAHPENARSHRLLIRLGFRSVPKPERLLGSYDPGDLVFVLREKP